MLGRRMARNTSALLVAESHVAAVADPAGGAYAVERLTDDLARVAWAELGRIETDGRDAFDDRVAAVRARPRGRRRHPAPAAHRAERVRQPRPTRSPARPQPLPTATARPSRRSAPSRPPRTSSWRRIGPVAAHTARAGFATNLLAAGGIAVDVAGATAGVDDLMAAVRRPARGLPGRHRRGVRRVGREAAAALRGAGARVAWSWSRPARPPSSSRRRRLLSRIGVDAIDFLTRTREALA